MLRLSLVANREQKSLQTMYQITVKAYMKIQVVKIAFKDKILLFL
jgi:hypothetical protein